MHNEYKSFFWSDNWCIEDDKAWFVAGMYNILCYLNLKTNQCESVIDIPDTVQNKFRLTPYCMKTGNDVYCMPDFGKSIWIYHLNTGHFSEIPINNPERIRLGVGHFWIYDNKVYAVSNGLKQVIEINIAERRIENYYDICKEGSITKSIREGMSIYSLSGVSSELYEFNLITKKTTTHKIPDVNEKLFTVCSDGNYFWMSGYKKKLYMWDKEKNTIKVEDKFPNGFGCYNFAKDTDGKVNYIINEYETPTFLYSVFVGDSFWFIPYQTNQILCWDRKSSCLSALGIDEEIETKESLLGRSSLWSKYIVEYIREDRYLGLFSIKNNCILEIDTLSKNVEMRYCAIDRKCLGDMMSIICEKNIFNENDALHKALYIYALYKQNAKNENAIFNTIGASIYKTICL